MPPYYYERPWHGLGGVPGPEEGRGCSRREGRRPGRSSSGTAPPFKPRTASSSTAKKFCFSSSGRLEELIVKSCPKDSC